MNNNLINPYEVQSQGWARQNGQSTSHDASSSNRGQPGQRNPDYNPDDRNWHFRPPTRQNQRNYSNNRPIRMTRTNFRRNVNLTNRNIPLPHAQSTSSLTVNINPRNKGIVILCKQRGTESVMLTLSKIAEDLQISLSAMKTLGFGKGTNEHELKIFMFFNDKAPYVKAAQKISLQEEILLNEDDGEIKEFIYECPSNLDRAFLPGEVFASVRQTDTLFTLKLSKSEGERKMMEAVEILTDLRLNHFGSQKSLLEDKIHSIRINQRDIIVSFNDEKIRNDFVDIMKRFLTQYSVSLNVPPTIVATSQGQNNRSIRNSVKLTPDMMNFFKCMSSFTPAMLESCKLLASGKYALMKTDDDNEVNQATERLNNVNFTSAMDTEELNATSSALQAPMTPNMPR